MKYWQWLLLQMNKKLWVRTTIFCVVAIFAAMTGFFIADIIPSRLKSVIKSDTVTALLTIIASSMLAVSTFSLSTMVSSYFFVASGVTPRANNLLLADQTSQNALSVFLGSFLFSIVGIIALSVDIFPDGGHVVLFFVSLIVIVIIVAELILWFNYLIRLGQTGDTINAVELTTTNSFIARMKHPYMGGTALLNDPPKSSWAVVSTKVGYVRYIDMQGLSKFADEKELKIYLKVLPGSFQEGASHVARVSRKLDDEECLKFCSYFDIGRERSFEQDPRFGLVVLAEIGSRALSPGVNDPGTAIAIIGTSVRVLTPWIQYEPQDIEVLFPRIHVPQLSTRDLFDDVFSPLATYGAPSLQVSIRLQKALIALHSVGNAEVRALAEEMSLLSYKRVAEALTLPEDIDRVWALVVNPPAKRPKV